MDQPRSIAFGAIERVAVFGGSWIVAALLPELKARPWELCIFTSSRHLADPVNDDGETLQHVLDRLDVRYHCSSAINEDPVALGFAGPATLGLAFGAAWTFEPHFAARFAGPLLDFMGIPLPEYRGGAHYTWQILNEERRGACNLQIVLGGEESFHRGPLIKTHRYTLPDSARTPQDYFAAAVAEERRFVLEFLDEVARGASFAESQLDEARASYFPFLRTDLHGWIDWSLSTAEVERFICAFDEPYAGASTYWRGRRVFLKGARRGESAGFHPFAAGLVFRADARGIWVCLNDDVLLVTSVRDEEGRDVMADIAPGSRFFTPRATIERALATEVVYEAAGPVARCTLP